MQLYIINWSFHDSEDQMLATNEFCDYINKGKLNQNIEGFELKFIAHTPQDGSGNIICKAKDIKTVFNLIKEWRDNYNIVFNIKPALTNEELLELNSSGGY